MILTARLRNCCCGGATREWQSWFISVYNHVTAATQALRRGDNSTGPSHTHTHTQTSDTDISISKHIHRRNIMNPRPFTQVPFLPRAPMVSFIRKLKDRVETGTASAECICCCFSCTFIVYTTRSRFSAFALYGNKIPNLQYLAIIQTYIFTT